MSFEQRIPAGQVPIKLTAKDFWLLAESGAFENYSRTELIEGEIWALNSVWRWQSRANFEFAVAIKEALTAASPDLTVYGPGSVAMSDDTVPEPDISVAEPEPSACEPISLSALKVAVELCEATQEMDLDRKPHLYARHGVPEYWVADRDTQLLVRHAQPGPEGYASIDRIPFGEPITSATLPGVIVETRSLLD